MGRGISLLVYGGALLVRLAGQIDFEDTSLRDLNGRVKVLEASGAHDQALRLAEAVVKSIENGNWADQRSAAVSYFNLAQLYATAFAPRRAEPLLNRSLEICEKLEGGEHPATAWALDNLGELYAAEEKYLQAVPLMQRALAINEKFPDPNSANVARSKANLGAVYLQNAEHDKAEPLLKAALAIREKQLGPEASDTLTVLADLAQLSLNRGNYRQADRLFARALAINEKVFGPDHVRIGRVLMGIGALRLAEGDYREAERQLRRALVIVEKQFGDHPNTALVLDKLAELFEAKGDYVSAEPVLVRALAIRENKLGVENPMTARALNNLASLYAAKNDFGRAQPLLQRALFICANKLAPDHVVCAAILSNLAVLLTTSGDYGQAERSLVHALAVIEKNRGPDHRETAAAAASLGDVYRGMRDYARAGAQYQHAFEITERALGPSHPDAAGYTAKLAMVSHLKGDYAHAEEFYRRALASYERTLGANHPAIASVLSNLALLYWQQHQTERAKTFLARSNQARERNLALILTTGSEEQKRAYLTGLKQQTDATISLHTRSAPNDPDILRLAMLTVVERKGRLLDAVAATGNTVRQRLQPADRTVLDELMRVRTLRANLAMRGPGSRDLANYREEIKKFEAREDELSAAISNRSAEFRVQTEPVTLARVQHAIPDRSALVEFVRYTSIDPNRLAREPQESARYAAYILFHSGEPAWTDLGDADPIDSLAQQFRTALSNPRTPRPEQMGRELDHLVFERVHKMLGDVTQVLLSPDGGLNLVPFAALVDEQGNYRVIRYTFTYLNSGRDLLRLRVQGQSRQGPILVADPDYDRRSATGSRENRRSAEMGNMQFRRLLATAQEGDRVRELLSLPEESVLTGERATEAALKRVSGPWLLHVATHGFFLADQVDAVQGSREFNVLDDAASHRTIAAGENPLLRSGLALAGANNLDGGAGEDGILTALEASSLDLWGTQLVVLSACQTAVGQVNNGEGVYGLRRALVLAGSQTQVMSLWKVSDVSTRDLMVAYYDRVLHGEGRSAALHAVQREMLQSKRSQPYYWAAFILSGDSGPLGE
jgi:CHAT domain-containing protein/tetratricopeptide (TPR) repeat protein